MRLIDADAIEEELNEMAEDYYADGSIQCNIAAGVVCGIRDEVIAHAATVYTAPAETKMQEAFADIVWYNGHYEWLKQIRDDLKKCDTTYSMPRDIVWYSEEHCIWMLLVGMFGDWGTSIRGGWIDETDACIDFLDLICKEIERFESERCGY